MAKLKDVLYKKNAELVDTALTRLRATYGGKSTLDQIIKALNSEYNMESEEYTLEEGTIVEPSFQSISLAVRGDASAASAVNQIIQSINKGMKPVFAYKKAVTDEMLDNDEPSSDRAKKLIKDAVKKLTNISIKENEEVDGDIEMVYESILAGVDTINEIGVKSGDSYNSKVRPCKSYNKKKGTCLTGCSKEGVIKDKNCPFYVEVIDGTWADMGNLQTKCSCYR